MKIECETQAAQTCLFVNYCVALTCYYGFEWAQSVQIYKSALRKRGACGRGVTQGSWQLMVLNYRVAEGA